MFNREEGKNSQSAETVIGSAIKVKGNFHGQGDIVIEGEVEGSVKTDNNLFIGDKARVIAGVEAKEAKIGGEVTGNIKIKGYLEITKTARINGDIQAGALSVEKGAVVNGLCNMSNTEARENKND